jgi:hypothetical protein
MLSARYISGMGAMFFLMCFGLGYAMLNRYGPNRFPNYDSQFYYGAVAGAPPQAMDAYIYRFRVLVPAVARPILWLSRGHLRTWDPVWFALLVTNSIFCSISGVLILILSLRMTGIPSVALMAPLIYFVNFTVVNEQLAGLVDSCEAWFLLIAMYALMERKYWILPICCVWHHG